MSHDPHSSPPRNAASQTPEAADTEELRPLLRVRFNNSCRTVDCDSGKAIYQRGEQVLVDDRRMGGLATVLIGTVYRKPKGLVGRVIRRADSRDQERAMHERNRQREALAFARSRVKAWGLPIKISRADVRPEGDRSVFYFSSDKRVDFRSLVRDLSSHFHSRVELRQINVRDEAKQIGGIGSCGRELCCSNHLTSLVPVSIRMAKMQRLVLNPAKIAGQCGRLKCCLSYEDAVYTELSAGLPKTGKRVETPDGTGRVDDVDVLRRTVRVSFLETAPKSYPVEEVRFLGQAASGGEITPEPVLVEGLTDSEDHDLGGGDS